MLEPRLKFTPLPLSTLTVLLSTSLLFSVAESAIGVNWGTVSFRRLKPSTVVDLMKNNKITKVKLFDTDPDVMKALEGSGIQVMVGIPNDMLSVLSTSSVACDLWVKQNLSAYIGKGGVDVRYYYFTLLS